MQKNVNGLQSLGLWTALLGSGLCISLLILRVHSVFSFTNPVWAITSGDEQSSLFAIWRAIQGQAVYFDRFEAPFSLASYNWLFYEAYSRITEWVLDALTRDTAWLPTVTRGITLVGACAMTVFTYLFTCERWRMPTWHVRGLCLSVAILSGVGPLVGFWAMTTRADIWATAIEAAAIFIFLRYHRRAPWRTLAAMVLLTYLAWSFKQTAILVIISFGLFLLMRRHWLQGVAFGVALAVFFALTFATFGASYVENILFLGVPLEYTPMRMIRNLSNFAIKTEPVVLVLLAAPFVLRLGGVRALFRESDGALFSALGLGAGLIICLLATNQLGSAENYYFTLTLFAALGWAELFASQAVRASPRFSTLHGMFFGGWAVLSVALVIVLSGAHGRTDIDKEQADVVAAKQCLDTLARPVFTTSNMHSLPWLIPGNGTFFVLSDLYDEDFKTGAQFAEDGIAGLLERQHFASIFTDASDNRESIYGTPLDGYVVVNTEACAAFRVLARVKP